MKLMKNLKEVFGALKRRSPSKVFCPKCGCSNIRLSSSLDYWLIPQKYVCENCGYVGSIVMELEKEEW